LEAKEKMVLGKLFSKSKDDAAQLTVAESGVHAKTKADAPILAVLGAKGGTGCTTIAINLSAALSGLYGGATIIDGHFQLPDVAHVLGRDPEHSLLELINRAADVDEHFYHACAREASDLDPKFKLLSPPLNGDAALKTDLTQLAGSLASMSVYTGCWIVDLPKHLDKHLVTFLDASAKIVLVIEATVSGIAACNRWLATFRDLGYSAERIICVLNRSGSKYNKTIESQLGESFGGVVIHQVPNAAQLMWDTTANGAPAVLAYPSHPYAKAIKNLAANIYQDIQGEENRVQSA
jgi:pilus assembly protein CpaE